MNPQGPAQPPSAPLDRLDPDCELPPHLLQMFVRAASKQLAELGSLCERRDAEGARGQAHKLKGGLYAVGATGLAEGTEALRGLLGSGDWTAVACQLGLIGEALASLIARLEQAGPGGRA